MNTTHTTARNLCALIGYAQWRNFDRLIQRAQQLISSGESTAKIEPTTLARGIGSNAIRHIDDYTLDDAAVALLGQLSAGSKLHRRQGLLRNETIMLGLLSKYFIAHGAVFSFQETHGRFVFDAVIDGRVVVEFDEPHHQHDPKQLAQDALKDEWASSNDYTMVRLTLDMDIIDMILAVDAVL